MKRMKCFKNYARPVYLGSVFALMLGGFLVEWLVKGMGFPESAAAVFLPGLPAVAVYMLENHGHLLDSTPGLLRGNHSFHVALPLALVCYGALVEDSVYSLNLYWSVSYLLCCYTTYITLYDAPDLRCAVFLVQTLLFGYVAVYRDVCAGSSIAVGVLSVFMLPVMAAGEQENPLSRSAATLALVCMAVCVTGLVADKLLYTAVPQQTAIVLDGFRNLMPDVRAFGMTDLPFSEYEGLIFGHQLGFLLARLGWAAAVPVAVTAAVMVISGFLTASNGRHSSVLCFGCQMLLTLRLLSGLLYMAGIAMGLCGDIPFLGGTVGQRAVDCLLCALVLLPAAPAELETLDSADPDFPVREAMALAELENTRTDLIRLCRYVYDNPDTTEGWRFLFGLYDDRMDTNTRRIMARNARSVLGPEVFRDNIAPLISPEDALEDAWTGADPEPANHFSSCGVFLKRYLGFRENLVIPPFFLAIGENALAEHPCLRHVSVPGTVLRICKNAFRGCGRLTGAELREDLLELDDYAFCDTGLTQIRLPSGLRRLGRSCFQNTALRSVEIPGTVSEISQDCFAGNTRLETVVLEDGVREIGAGAFCGCSALRSIRIPGSIRNIHPTAFAGCGALEDVQTEAGWEGRPVDPLLPVLFPGQNQEEKV